MSDSEDDGPKPVPPKVNDIFGESSDEDGPKPPPPKKGPVSADGIFDSDGEDEKPKPRKIKTKLDKEKEDAAKEGGDADDDESDDEDFSVSDENDDPSSRRKIDKRKSFGNDAEDESEDSSDDEDDNDDDSDDSDEEEEREMKNSKNKKRSRDVDGNDSDESDPFADSRKGKKDKRNKKKSKKSKKQGASRFFEDMAGKDYDSEEDLEYERGVTQEELTAEEEAANKLVESRHARNREMLETDVNELAAKYEEEHKHERRRQRKMREALSSGVGVGQTTVAQQALLPSVQDPSIWRVKCQTGREFQLVRSILMRHIDQINKGEPVTTLKSAFHSTVKGYIYIEAFSEVCAKKAVGGLRGLYQQSFTKVSIPEMTSVISVQSKNKPLQEGQWVRLRRGALKGDLAKIVELADGGTKAFVMAVPRPDYTQVIRDATGKEIKKGKLAGVRPPKKIFDTVEAQSSSGVDAERKSYPSTNIRAGGGFYDFWKGDYYRDGFWFKEVNTASYVQGQDVKPKLEELQMFRNGGPTKDEDMDADWDEEEGGGYLQDSKKGGEAVDEGPEDMGANGATENGTRKFTSLKQETDKVASMQKTLLKELSEQILDAEDEEEAERYTTTYAEGDLVKVVGGELQGLIAIVRRVAHGADVLHVQAFNTDIKSLITVERSLVIKHIEPGSHVKIIHGRYTGSTGRVVAVSVTDGDHLAAILTDGVNNEIQVNVAYTQMSNEVSVGHGNLGGFELFDCVSLSENETAVIINVGLEKLRLINHMNLVKEVYPQDIMNKRNTQSSKQSAFDSQQNTIVVGDQVTVQTGQEYLNKVGSVKHVMRGNLWIYSPSHLQNAGVMVVRARNCLLNGQKLGVMGAPVSKATLAAGAQTMQSGAKGRSKDPDVGKTIKILKGGYKGKLAQVVDVNPTQYTVELLARVKKIMIDRVKCKIVGDKNGAFEKSKRAGFGSSDRDMANPLGDVGTPFLSGETPMHLGGETPMYGAGSETPAGAYGDDPDSLFGVTDRDREIQQKQEEQAFPPIMAQHTMDHKQYTQWNRGFIVRVLHSDWGTHRHAMLETGLQGGVFHLRLIEQQGTLDVHAKTASPDQLELAAIMINAVLLVVNPMHTNVGFIGRCSYLANNSTGDEEVILNGVGHCENKGSVMFSTKDCVVIYHEGL